MKKVKFISLVFSMLISFIVKAQQNSIPKEQPKNSFEEIKIKTQPFTKVKDTIPTVNVSSNFVQPATNSNRIIICAPSNPLMKEPLYILDGNLIDAKKMSKINPSDIQEIKVLKGKEAASLYGNQAINGVIIITTKDED